MLRETKRRDEEEDSQSESCPKKDRQEGLKGRREQKDKDRPSLCSSGGTMGDLAGNNGLKARSTYCGAVGTGSSGGLSAGQVMLFFCSTCHIEPTLFVI